MLPASKGLVVALLLNLNPTTLCPFFKTVTNGLPGKMECLNLSTEIGSRPMANRGAARRPRRATDARIRSAAEYNARLKCGCRKMAVSAMFTVD